MKKIVMILGIALLFSGCASLGLGSVNGSLYADTKASVTATGERGSKVGEATCTVIFGVATGDCSIQAAKKNGKISKVSSVDNETFSVLGVYATYKTIVTGE